MNQIFSGLNPLPENDSKIRLRKLVLEKRHGHPTYEDDNKNTEQEEEDESGKSISDYSFDTDSDESFFIETKKTNLTQ